LRDRSIVAQSTDPSLALRDRSIARIRRSRTTYIYPPKSAYLINFYVVTGCYFSLWPRTNSISCQCAPLARVSFTYLHTTIYTTQMKFLATPLLTTQQHSCDDVFTRQNRLLPPLQFTYWQMQCEWLLLFIYKVKVGVWVEPVVWTVIE